MKRIQQGIGGIPENKRAANHVERTPALAAKISFQRNGFAGNKNGVGGHGFQIYGVNHAGIERICFPRRIRGADPSILAGLQFLRVLLRRGPPFAVEGCKRDASPAQPLVSNRLAGLHAHDYRGILFDFADLTEFHAFGETGHERGIEAGAPKVPGIEAREAEKQHATENDGSGSHAESRKAQSAI